MHIYITKQYIMNDIPVIIINTLKLNKLIKDLWITKVKRLHVKDSTDHIVIISPPTPQTCSCVKSVLINDVLLFFLLFQRQMHFTYKFWGRNRETFQSKF